MAIRARLSGKLPPLPSAFSNTFDAIVADLALHMDVVDTGRAKGLNSAAIGIPQITTTNAPAGTAVQARIVTQNGDQELDWVTVGTFDGSGVLDGLFYPVLTNARRAGWFHIEVRCLGSSVEPSRTASTFALGTKGYIFGQSETYQATSTVSVIATDDGSAHNNRYQVILYDSVTGGAGADVTETSIARRFVDVTDDNSPVNEMFRLLASRFPADEHVSIIIEAVAGTAPYMLVDDQATFGNRRHWDTNGMKEILDYAGGADGNYPGAWLDFSGVSTPEHLGYHYKDVAKAIFGGIDATDAAMVYGTDIVITPQPGATSSLTLSLDHSVLDASGQDRAFLDRSKTAIGVVAYQRAQEFETSDANVMAGPTDLVVDASLMGQAGYHQALYELSQDSTFQSIVPTVIVAPFPADLNVAGSLGLHPTNDTPDAQQLWFSWSAYCITQLFGLTPALPVIDTITQNANGSATFGIAGQSVTTTRLLRGEGAPPADGNAARNAVMGFSFAGVWADAGTATINSGAIEISAVPSSIDVARIDLARDCWQFNHTSPLTHTTDDAAAAAWKDIPGVANWIPGLQADAAGVVAPLRNFGLGSLAAPAFHTAEYVTIPKDHYWLSTETLAALGIGGETFIFADLEYAPVPLAGAYTLFGFSQGRLKVSTTRQWAPELSFIPSGPIVTGDVGSLAPPSRRGFEISADITPAANADKTATLLAPPVAEVHTADFAATSFILSNFTGTKQVYIGHDPSTPEAGRMDIGVRLLEVYDNKEGTGTPVIRVAANSGLEVSVSGGAAVQAAITAI